MGPTKSIMPMLSVADLGRSLRFYEAALGGERRYAFPAGGDPLFLTLGFGTNEIGLGTMRGATLHGRPQRPATGHRIELCLEVEDLDSAYAALLAIGAPGVVEPCAQPWGERIAYVEDPDGNLVMLTEPACAGSPEPKDQAKTKEAK